MDWDDIRRSFHNARLQPGGITGILTDVIKARFRELPEALLWVGILCGILFVIHIFLTGLRVILS